MSTEAEPSQPEATETNWSLLARESFGSDYKGEVKETPQEEQTEELQVEESIEVTEESVEAEPEVTEEAPTEPTTEEAEVEQTPLSLSDLIESEGYDQDEFMSLEVEQKIDGETRRVTLSDLIATNQTLEAADKRLQEAKDKAKSQNQALAEKEQNLDALIGIAGSFLQEQQQALQKEYAELDKDTLRDTDPAEWAAKKQEIQDRITAFNGKVNQWAAAHQQSKTQKEDETNQQRQERLQQEHQALSEHIEGWGEEDAREKVQDQIGSYLTKLEVSTDSLSAIDSDHKLFIMANKARLYDELETKAEPAKKKLRTVPKTLKPGPKPAPVNSNQTEIERLEKVVKNNPNSEDAFNAKLKIMKLRRG